LEVVLPRLPALGDGALEAAEQYRGVELPVGGRRGGDQRRDGREAAQPTLGQGDLLLHTAPSRGVAASAAAPTDRCSGSAPPTRASASRSGPLTSTLVVPRSRICPSQVTFNRASRTKRFRIITNGAKGRTAHRSAYRQGARLPVPMHDR